MELTTVTVKVGSRDYQLTGMEEPQHYERLAQVADRRLREVARQSPGLIGEAQAIAALLSLAEDLVKAGKEAALLRKALEDKAQEASLEG